MTLREAKRSVGKWTPIHDLIASDDAIWKPETQELGYAESWLLVHYLMKDAEQLPKFRAYLTDVNKAQQKGRIASHSSRSTSVPSTPSPPEWTTTWRVSRSAVPRESEFLVNTMSRPPGLL